MRDISGNLVQSGVPFDVGGYSKGGGLAQEAGLISTGSRVYVFNSAGLSDASLARTGQSSFDSLASRTTAFSSQGEFLTYMNNTKDPDAQVRNAEYLRQELGGEGSPPHPISVTYRNPAMQGKSDPAFAADRTAFLSQLDGLVADRRAHPDGPPLFPPVRAGSENTVPDSMSKLGSILGAGKDYPNLGKLAQHKLDNVVGPMQSEVDRDRAALKNFQARCG